MSSDDRRIYGFQECEACRGKPGSQVLCASCLSNRFAIESLLAKFADLPPRAEPVASPPVRADVDWLGRLVLCFGKSLEGRAWATYHGTVIGVTDDGGLVNVKTASLARSESGLSPPYQWFPAGQVRFRHVLSQQSPKAAPSEWEKVEPPVDSDDPPPLTREQTFWLGISLGGLITVGVWVE